MYCQYFSHFLKKNYTKQGYLAAALPDRCAYFCQSYHREKREPVHGRAATISANMTLPDALFCLIMGRHHHTCIHTLAVSSVEVTHFHSWGDGDDHGCLESQPSG
jgi:hypothetical protein